MPNAGVAMARVRISNFFWSIRHGCVRTRKWSWGFCWLWRYKNHAICLRHGLSGPDFNHEWNYWFCRECHPPRAYFRQKIVLLLASTFRQAEIVCDELHLPPPRQRTGDTRVVVITPQNLQDIYGLKPDRVIEAKPDLVGGMGAVRAVTRARYAGAIEVVWT